MIKEFLQRLAEKNNDGNGPWKNKRLGITLKIISGVTVAGITLTGIYLLFKYGDLPAILFLGGALFVFSPIIGLWDYGKSLLARRGEDFLKEVKEGVILFLRSFEKDVEDGLGNPWETKLIDILDAGQQSVAIGKPKELFQTLGAPRVYFSDDEWKSQTSELIERANLVVLRMGKTQGLLWEVGETISKCPPSKLLLFHPLHSSFDYMDEVEYSAFVKDTAGWFVKPIPPFPMFAKYAVLIGFKADGEPYLLTPEKRYLFMEKIFGGGDDLRLQDLYLLSATRDLRKQLHNKNDWRLDWEYFSVVSRYYREILLMLIAGLMAVGLLFFLFWMLIVKH